MNTLAVASKRRIPPGKLHLATTAMVIGLLSSFAQAALINYSLSVTPTNTEANPFAGQTFTGTFEAETATGAITNFSANLLGGSFVVASLPAGSATFDVGGNVTTLHFGGLVVQSCSSNPGSDARGGRNS